MLAELLGSPIILWFMFGRFEVLAHVVAGILLSFVHLVVTVMDISIGPVALVWVSRSTVIEGKGV